MNIEINHIRLLLLAALLITAYNAHAQTEQLDLQQAVDAALRNNHQLNIKKLQVEEGKAKVQEDNIKKFPSVTINSTYQYNANVGSLVVPQGSFGSLPLNNTVIPLPNENKSFELGQYHTFNAGVTVYQPVTQQGKIRTGVAISAADVRIREREQEKAAQQITQAVEKVYYGLLINRKQKEEAAAKLEAARIRLYDVESALLAGKTVTASKAGLLANVADEEQNLLKLDIQADDYTADLKRLTGLTADSFRLADVETTVLPAAAIDQYKAAAATNNTDLRLAALTQEKATLAIKAARQSYLPDLGLMAGYVYQKGYVIYPTNNPFAGVNFKWNLQDIFSNRQVLKQRAFLLQQARENIASTQEQVNSDIEQSCRQLEQATALINAAQKAVQYRKEELKIQDDKRAAGLNTQIDVLNARSALAKSAADLYAAQLHYRLVLSDLRRMTEGK